MNTSAALVRLAAIGVTDSVITAEGVDPADPVALRSLVESLLASVVAENSLVVAGQVTALQAALGDLYTADEVAACDVLATDLVKTLEANLRRWPAADEVYGDRCLHAA